MMQSALVMAKSNTTSSVQSMTAWKPLTFSDHALLIPEKRKNEIYKYHYKKSTLHEFQKTDLLKIITKIAKNHISYLKWIY